MKKIVISSDCVADIPKFLAEKYRISIMYCYILTEHCRFRDWHEIDSQAVVDYMASHEDYPRSQAAPAEEYREHFQRLMDEGADEIIHFSVARHFSECYNRAIHGAEGMENVHVVDTGALSGAMAIVVLLAADLAMRGAPLAVILSAAEKKKKMVNTSFITMDPMYMAAGKRMNERVAKISKRLHLRPVCEMRDSRLRIGAYLAGNQKRCARTHLKWLLRQSQHVDGGIICIMTVGCTPEFQTWLYEETKRRLRWDRVIVHNASATVSCNWGPGTFGVFFSKG